MLLVKKYPNRRLYDTQQSRYITLEDLEDRVRRGADVVVQDAATGGDLTQETLTQIILERGGGRILPASLLLRLIRLDDEALAEFLTRYVGWALEVYVGAKQRAKALSPLNPLATAPFAATEALARMMLGASQWRQGASPAPAAPMPAGDGAAPPPPDADAQLAAAAAAAAAEVPPPPPPVESEIERIRRELDELKRVYAVGAAERDRGPTTKKKKTAKRASAAKRG